MPGFQWELNHGLALASEVVSNHLQKPVDRCYGCHTVCACVCVYVLILACTNTSKVTTLCDYPTFQTGVPSGECPLSMCSVFHQSAALLAVYLSRQISGLCGLFADSAYTVKGEIVHHNRPRSACIPTLQSTSTICTITALSGPCTQVTQ